MITRFENFNPKIYFAHPKSTYGTDVESNCIKIIESYFKVCDIINPATLQDDFKSYKIKNSNYRQYFKDLISSCNILVLLPFRDNRVGFGIIYEVECIHPDNIYQIDLENSTLSKVSIDDVKSRGLNLEETAFRNKLEF